jgi:hypothetical protein
MDFQKTARAVEHCVRQRLLESQLVLNFGEDRQLDIMLPVCIPSGAPAKKRPARNEPAKTNQSSRRPS